MENKKTDIEIAMEEFLNDSKSFDKEIAEIQKKREIAYQKKLESKFSKESIQDTARKNTALLEMESKEILSIDEEIKELKSKISSLKENRKVAKKSLIALGNQTKKLLSIAKVKAKSKTSEICKILANGTLVVTWQKHAFNSSYDLLNKVWYNVMKEEILSIDEIASIESEKEKTDATKNFLFSVSAFVRNTFDIQKTQHVTQEKIDEYISSIENVTEEK